MKAMTVRQPWASAIALDHPHAKRVENRGRPTSWRGPIAIHAGKAADTTADKDTRITALFGNDPRVGMPTGKVLAVADLVDCHQAVVDADGQACCHPWGAANYTTAAGVVRAWHLVLADVRQLPRPVGARGALSLPWTLPADAAELVEAQLADLSGAVLS